MPKIRAATVAEHRAQTETALADALEALLTTKEYEAITLAEIAAQAGVSRATVYNYVDDKDALLVSAAERSGLRIVEEVRGLAESTEGGANAQLSAVAGLVATLLAEGMRSLLLLQNRAVPVSYEVRDRAAEPFVAVKTSLADIVRVGVASGAFAPDADSDLTIELVLGAIGTTSRRVMAAPAEANRIIASMQSFLGRALAAES